jgi:hypothetical protein
LDKIEEVPAENETENNLGDNLFENDEELNKIEKLVIE